MPVFVQHHGLDIEIVAIGRPCDALVDIHRDIGFHDLRGREVGNRNTQDEREVQVGPHHVVEAVELREPELIRRSVGSAAVLEPEQRRTYAVPCRVRVQERLQS